MKQTLDQSGTVVGQILEDDIPAPVPEESEQRRRLAVVLGDGIPDLDDAPIAAAQQLDAVATGIGQEEPGSGGRSAGDVKLGARGEWAIASDAAYHPPGSATAASWASLTLGSSSPFNDMSPAPVGVFLLGAVCGERSGGGLLCAAAGLLCPAISLGQFRGSG